MPAAVKSSFDVAFWFADTALNDNEYLQPQKLHRLMFMAQAYYAAAYGGRKLMPAVFVADDMGPVEPNVYVAFSKGRPDIDVDMFMPDNVELILDSIWRRFGHYTVDRLTRMTTETLAYRQAIGRGKRAEISLEAMRLSFSRGREAPSIDRVVKPKIMLSHTGKPVTVKSWMPGTK